MKKIISLFASLVLVTAAYAASFPDITISEVKASIAAKNVVLLDANGTDSWRDGHIPGALDFQSSKAKLAELLPKDKNALVVAYCGNPRCPAYKQAADAAKELGYTNVKHLSAGIQGWVDAGEKVEKAQPK